MRRLVIAGIALVLTVGHPFAQTTPADLVLQNGKILTVDARDSIAQAVRLQAGGSSRSDRPTTCVLESAPPRR